MSVKTKDLRFERGQLWDQAKAITDKVDAEKRAFTAEEQATFDALHAKMEELRGTIDRLDKQAGTDRELAGSEVRAGTRLADGEDPPADPEAREKRYAMAFDRYRRGFEMGSEDRAVLQGRFVAAGKEERAQSTTAAAGGYMIPQAFSGQLEVALKAYSGVLQAVTPFVTDDGATMPWPTTNDTAQLGEQLGENTQASAQDATFAVVNLAAYMYSSKVVLVSYQLLQDAAFDLDGLLSRLLAERIGRILNQRFTTGTGSSQPNGCVTAAIAAGSGTTLGAGNTTSITYDGVIDLIHSIDPAYRASPSAALMMHDTTLATVKKIKDSQNRPLWQPGMIDGEPDRIWGYRYFINQDMAVPAANAYTMLFGDWSKYVVRQVRGFQLLRLTERYADYLQVGFLGFARYDANLIDAGTKPLKFLRQSAT